MSNSVCQRVGDSVPPFSGEELLIDNVLKMYLRGWDIAVEGSKAEEEPAVANSLIDRLYGRTFEIAVAIPFKTVKQLPDLLRELYLKPKDLDIITDEIQKTY